MCRLKRPFLFGLIVTVTMSLPLRTAPQRLPTIDQTIDHLIAAIGGRNALAESGPLIMSGHCESTAPDESGPIEILVRTPKVAFDLNAGGLRMGFDGNTVWRATAAEGLQQRKGRQFAELVTVFDPSRVLLWKEWYPSLKVTGIQKVGNSEWTVLETLPGNPATERIFIDRETGFLVRDEVTPQIAFTFSDFRVVGGIHLAFKVEQTSPAGISYIYHFETIKPTSASDASLFQPK